MPPRGQPTIGKHLFIGGPLHDQVRSVEDDRSIIRAAKPTKGRMLAYSSGPVEPCAIETVVYVRKVMVYHEEGYVVYVAEGHDLQSALQFALGALLRDHEIAVIADRLPGWITRPQQLAKHLWVAHGVFEHNLRAMAQMHRIGKYRFEALTALPPVEAPRRIEG